MQETEGQTSSLVFPNGAKWKEATQTNMLKARNLAREMLTKVRDNEVAEAANKDAAMEQAMREKEGKKKQVMKAAAVHSEIISTSYRCMLKIEDAILQTEDCLSKLTHERYKGFAMLQVCERRQGLRAKRPAAENFKDSLSEALDAERRVLEAMRKELFALEEEGKTIVDDMMNMRSFLSHDTGERRLEMAHDLATLKPHFSVKAPEDVEEAVLLPGEVPDEAAGKAAPKEAAKEKEGPKSEELIKATLSLLERAHGHRQRAMDCCKKSKQEQTRSNQYTEHSLARRTTELAELKRKLEKHALDVDAAILTAERSLARTEHRLDPGDKKKCEKHAQDKALLTELRSSRLKLADDIRNKFAALEIDNMCRRVTPAKASEAKRVNPVRTQSAPCRRKELGSAASGTGTSASTDLGTMTPADMESLESTSRPGTSSMSTTRSCTTLPPISTPSKSASAQPPC